MNVYPSTVIQALKEHRFAFIEVKEVEHVLYLTLDRAKKKNALHPQMVNEIAYAMQYAHHESSIWILVFQAKGSVFCAGADLKAMMGIIEENDSTIPQPEQPVLIGELFNKVHKPCIAKVTGDVYAGGFFFLAGCTIVLAQQGIKLGLPEVKRGLFPFQVMAALLRVMPARKVLDWCIRGYNLKVEEALQYGLISQINSEVAINEALDEVIAELKQNSPSAIKNGLAAYDHIQSTATEHQYLLNMLMQTIGTKDGQEGLKAFREKRAPVWTGE